MVILITGASHTGKTLLAQRLLEKHHIPYLSIDHLKMGLIRSGNTALTPEQAENFDEVFGTNTGYVVDPEECMADNFTYALQYGMSGPDGNGYPNPEIIAAILEYLSR